MDIFVNIITLTDEEVPGAKLPNEPEKCSVMQLERWLEYRGRKKTGKLNMPIDLKVDGGLWYDKKAKRKPTIEEITKTRSTSTASRRSNPLIFS